MSKRFFLIISFITFIITVKGQNDSIIRQAMKDELNRNMKELKYKDFKEPFFISYTIEDMKNIMVIASLGAIISSDENHARSWANRVMIGDYKTTDENYIDLNRNKKQGDGDIELPIDDDYLGIRRTLWLATNNVYKSAVENYKAKIQSLKDKKLSNSDSFINDFSVSPVTKLIIKSKPVKWDVQFLNNISREVSAEFKNYGDIQYSQIAAYQIHAVLVFVNSENSEVEVPFDVTSFSAIALTQTDDGETLSDQMRYCVTDPNQLPSLDEMKSDIKAMADNLIAKRSAKPLDDNYTGPVLIEGQPVADVFTQTLFSGKSSLIAYREPLYGSPQSSIYYGDNINNLESKIDKLVMAKDITVKSTPRIEKYNGVPLLGCFDVDAEAVVPPKELPLIENGVLKTLLNGRVPSRSISQSNGHNRYILYHGSITQDVAPGVINISVSNGKPTEKLKDELINEAKDLGLSYALIIKPIKVGPYTYPVNVYSISVKDGKEELLRSFSVKQVSSNVLKKITSVSDKTMVYNFLLADQEEKQGMAASLMFDPTFIVPSGAPVSFIMPNALILPELEVEKESRPVVTEKPIVKNPLAK